MQSSIKANMYFRDIEKPDTEFNSEIKTYVNCSTGYYLNRFKEMEKGGSQRSWNWCGFFFSLGWMIYRKMYISAATVYVCCLSAGLIGYFFVNSFDLYEPHIFFHLYNIMILLTCSIVIGLFGNCWYRKHIDGLIEEGKHFCKAKKANHIKRAGGTCKSAVTIFALINVMILYLGSVG